MSNLQAANVDEAVNGLFAEDAVFISPGATFTGREAIRAMFSALPARFIDGRIESASVHVHGDVAYEFGTNQTTVERPDGSRVKSKGRYLSVWRREPDGRWLIIADAPISDPA